MTESNPEFGPQGEAVAAFLSALPSWPWFRHVGEPLPEDARLIRVDFDFIARNFEDPYAPWHGAVEAAESRLEKLIVAHSRQDFQSAIQQVVALEPFSEELFEMLFEEYEDYYGNTQLYAHQLVHLPDRLLRGAACELMLADVARDESGFFTSLLPWFERGHWPCGWEGSWPAGKLLVW